MGADDALPSSHTSRSISSLSLPLSNGFAAGDRKESPAASNYPFLLLDVFDGEVADRGRIVEYDFRFKPENFQLDPFISPNYSTFFKLIIKSISCLDGKKKTRFSSPTFYSRSPPIHRLGLAFAAEAVRWGSSR